MLPSSFCLLSYPLDGYTRPTTSDDSLFPIRRCQVQTLEGLDACREAVGEIRGKAEGRGLASLLRQLDTFEARLRDAAGVELQ